MYIGNKKHFRILTVAIISILICSAVFYSVKTKNLPFSSCRKKVEVCEFHFPYVGQGDAILIRSPDGDVLVDSGPNSSEDLIVGYLEDVGVEELFLTFITHPDEDHIGGADRVISSFRSPRVYLPDPDSRDSDCRALRAAASSLGIRLQKASGGDVFTVGKLKLTVISPREPLFGDPNDDSLVIVAEYGSVRVMLTGDMSVKTEKRLLSEYPESVPRCDILKAGHHGSSTSSSEEWIKAVSPAYAVISCGKQNAFGHPHAEVVSRLNSLGIEVLRTDRSGNIVFETDGKNLSLRLQ